MKEEKMKKSRLYKILCLTLGLGAAFSGTFLNAASITKTLKAAYGNIAVSYNGQAKTLSSQPFIVDGTTYVPLRAVGEIMGATVNWANNTVYITNASTSTVSSDQELAAKNFEIASLKQRLDAANKELETYKGTGTAGSNLTTAAISRTLTEIKDEYDFDYSVEWTFDLRIVSSRLELTVSYDSRYDSSDFAKITESQRRQFIKEICYDIAALHKDTEIRGVLKDSRGDTEVATFRYTKNGSYTYEQASYYSFSDFSRRLERDYTVINTTGFSIPIRYIEISEKNGGLVFTLTTEFTTTAQRDNWNSLTASAEIELERVFYNIKRDIEREYPSYNSIVGVIRENGLTNNVTLGSYEANGRFYPNKL